MHVSCSRYSCASEPIYHRILGIDRTIAVPLIADAREIIDRLLEFLCQFRLRVWVWV